jgi:hypothetical protein
MPPLQNIGVYAKDDNNKAALIDGRGGVLYEHDVSSHDEGEGAEDVVEDQPVEESADEENAPNEVDKE